MHAKNINCNIQLDMHNPTDNPIDNDRVLSFGCSSHHWQNWSRNYFSENNRDISSYDQTEDKMKIVSLISCSISPEIALPDELKLRKMLQKRTWNKIYYQTELHHLYYQTELQITDIAIQGSQGKQRLRGCLISNPNFCGHLMLAASDFGSFQARN